MTGMVSQSQWRLVRYWTFAGLAGFWPVNDGLKPGQQRGKTDQRERANTDKSD
jgi:hypothetical protein